jgi:hypothetical protein
MVKHNISTPKQEAFAEAQQHLVNTAALTPDAEHANQSQVADYINKPRHATSATLAVLHVAMGFTGIER